MRSAILNLLAVLVGQVSAQPKREPLPLDLAASLASHNGRSSFDLSPDGAWLAQTVERPDRVEADGAAFTKSGFPLAEGNARMQAILTHTTSGEVIRLGGSAGVSWAPVWSPDGKRVAFYADDDGQAGIWIWELATRRARRFPGVVARPFFGFEVIRWSKDGRRLLCKILPNGLTVADANRLIPRTEEGRVFPPRRTGQPSVLVFKSEARASGDSGLGNKPAIEASAFTFRSLADLALLDLVTGKATRIAERVKALWYAFSPDERYIAYTDLRGFAPNTQQPGYAIAGYEIATGRTHFLVDNAYLGYGIEINWSPDSRQLAYIGVGSLGQGALNLVSVPQGQVRSLASDRIPSFDPGDGEHPPLWAASGEALFAIGDGALWRVDVASGAGRAIAAIPDHQIRAIVTRPELPTLWTTDAGKTAWVTARETAGDRAGIFKVDLATGQPTAMLQEKRAYRGIFNLDASNAEGIAFVATDQQHLDDGWLLDTGSGKVAQVSHLNPELEGYELGTARVLSYRGLAGQPLKSALLLPPGFKEGQRLPLVVWVYGGAMGSQYVNRFGFWGDNPVFNMHVLATRGYAVLFPDTPLGPGTPMKDLYETVMPAVNAAIDQGYADPDRLAVTGQSYGSYSSLALISQTKRFKAAIITAAVLHPDLFSAYLEMSPDGTARSTGYYEQGQGNMGGTPWQYRDRYFENSPLFRFDQIDTPLLIGQGETDGRLIASDAMFVGLRRLGKTVEYRVYQGEDHVLTQRVNVLDFWRRRLEFLAEHLKLRVDQSGMVSPLPPATLPN